MDNNNNPSPQQGNKKGSRQWMTADPMEYELLKENAKNNRKCMTEAESAFWTMVKGNALGQRCIRQHVIGDYIVDFLFRKSKVVVEIDGGYHFDRNRPSKSPCLGRLWNSSVEIETIYEDQVEKDRVRQEWLEHQGYRVVRFTNEEVLLDTENVINKIKEYL